MYDRLRPVLFRLSPERAHHAATVAAKLGQRFAGGLLEREFAFDDIRLSQTLWKLKFSNPFGLAAGFDKNARLIRFWEGMGMGYVEVGSVTARASRGNRKPRMFRLPQDEALINRLGLGNEGANRVARRLRTSTHTRPLGVNIAKTHDPKILGEAALEDFRESYRLLAPLADYVALNVSCPNTAEGKTFEDPAALETLLQVISIERDQLTREVPLLLKLSPPMNERIVFDSLYEETIALARAYRVDGFIATNTASDRDDLTTDAETLRRIGPGGVSGRPLASRSTHLVRYLFDRTGGTMPIIGVGGVDSAEAAYHKIRAGASLVQLYTALVYHGPGLIRRMKQELVAMLQRDGFGNVRQAVGRDARGS